MHDIMTTADAQAMIEEVLAFERGEVVTEEKGYDIEQKPGKDYWYVKRDGKKLGAISKGKNEKFDADTDTEGGGKYKAGFDTIAAAAEWLVSKDKTAKTESELVESNFEEAYGAFRTIYAAYKPNFDRLYTAVRNLVKENPHKSMVSILFKEVQALQLAMAKLERDFADLKKHRIEDEELGDDVLAEASTPKV